MLKDTVFIAGLKQACYHICIVTIGEDSRVRNIFSEECVRPKGRQCCTRGAWVLGYPFSSFQFPETLGESISLDLSAFFCPVQSLLAFPGQLRVSPETMNKYDAACLALGRASIISTMRCATHSANSRGAEPSSSLLSPLESTERPVLLTVAISSLCAISPTVSHKQTSNAHERLRTGAGQFFIVADTTWSATSVLWPHVIR